MRGWLRQHGLACADALRHLYAFPGNFLLNVMVVTIALALPIAGLTLLENVRPVTEKLAVEPELSIFLATDTSRIRANALAPKIQRVMQETGSSGRLEFIPRENALTALKSRTGFSDTLTALGQNPLPDAYVLKLTGVQTTTEAAGVDILAVKLKALPDVEYVQVDSAWIKRLAALMQVLRLALFFLATTLGVVVVAVIFNTIRLQVMTQREEIEVSRLCGATDSYIYRPFYYTGTLLGVMAGATALIVVSLSLQPMNQAVAEFARLYASEFRLVPLSTPMVAAVLVLCALLGLFAARFSVKRHLSTPV